MKSINEYDDPDELRQIMRNAKRLGHDNVWWAAFARLCLITGKEEPDPLVREFYATLAAYEELLSERNGRRTPATRTRQKLKRTGVIQCLEEWAFQKTSSGLELLVEKGLTHLTGEALVMKYAERFSPGAVAAAKTKLAAVTPKRS